MSFQDNFAMICAKSVRDKCKTDFCVDRFKPKFRGFNQLPSRAPNSVMRNSDYANMMSN